MTDRDLSREIQQQVQQAAAAGRALCIRGGGSKAFYGRRPHGEPLEMAGHRGILSYEPSELVITARAGTPLAEIEQALEEQGQMLAFEPPHFGPGATIGGAVASGLAGPRRPWGGAPRDLLLGVRLIDGQGRSLKFGGQVMKNVAGYDVSRLMAGALGCLGVLLEVSLKVLPRPPQEQSLELELERVEALGLMRQLAVEPLPLTGACYLDGRLCLRLGAGPALFRATAERLGATAMADGEEFWRDLRDHRLPFYQTDAPLWRLSLPPASPDPELPGTGILDWAGAQRWILSDASEERIRDLAAAAGGHACRFRGGDPEGGVFHPLPPEVLALHRRLKQVLDPKGLFNPGRMYAEF